MREGVFVYFLHGYAARPQAVALGLAFYAVGTITALGGAAVLIVRFIRHGMGAVRPRTEIGAGRSGARPHRRWPSNPPARGWRGGTCRTIYSGMTLPRTNVRAAARDDSLTIVNRLLALAAMLCLAAALAGALVR